jgi:pimeloyl-ACP methyl ester carboxylesterase
MLEDAPVTTITLSDGRTLAYAEYGDQDGSPAFYFHGTPGCRFEGRFLHDAARANGMRLIAVDRPGYGRSSYQHNRRIEDWPDDVAQLADALGIDRFAVIGLSGGGPHAQACAAKLADRVTSAQIVSGAGSPNAVLDGRRGIGRFFTKALLAFAPLFAWLTAMWVAVWAPVARQWMVPRRIDRAVTARRDVRQAFVELTRVAMRPGGRAMAQDLRLFARPWGFAPTDVGRVPVHIWHGDADTIVPVSVGRYFARTIPNARSTFIAGAGHLMIVDHAGEILASVRHHPDRRPAATTT